MTDSTHFYKFSFAPWLDLLRKSKYFLLELSGGRRQSRRVFRKHTNEEETMNAATVGINRDPLSPLLLL